MGATPKSDLKSEKFIDNPTTLVVNHNNHTDILCWQYCKICKCDVTPKRFLTNFAGRIAFSKFLELIETKQLVISKF